MFTIEGYVWMRTIHYLRSYEDTDFDILRSLFALLELCPNQKDMTQREGQSQWKYRTTVQFAGDFLHQ
jgi:hypothetical protein